MKKYLITISIFITINLCVLQLSYAQKANDASAFEMEQRIDELFSSYKDPGKPGLAVSIIKDGSIAYSKGFGSANLEYDVPITPSTVFHVASLSKQFTVFAILLLEEDGKLSLDDDVRKYIPEVPDFSKVITLKHLACHASGLRDQWRLLELSGWRLDDVITTEHIMNLVSKQKKLNFDPGDDDVYSNTGFTLLAEVVARVSGQSFADFTMERIFQPLGMTNTLFYDDHQKIVKNRAYSYRESDGHFKKSVLSFATVGPTSLLTTAADMALWAMNFETLEVGTQAMIDKMNTQPTFDNGRQSGFALGQFRGSYDGIEVYGHSGSDAGYKAYFMRIPEHRLAIAVLANEASISPRAAVVNTIDLYLSDYFKKEEEKPRVFFQPDPTSFISLPTSALAQFEGDYWEAIEGYQRKIYVKNDTLMYFRSEGNESKLVPIAANKFKMLGDTEDVTLIFNNGQVGEPQLEFYINDRPPIIFLAFTEFTPMGYTGTFYSEELSTAYTFKLEDGRLVAEHPRLRDITFDTIQKDVFKSDNRNYRSLQFFRDEQDAIAGLQFSSYGARKVWFEKKGAL